MQVETLLYHTNQGWTKPLPKLDSTNTLILAFCAPEYFENVAPLDELKKAFPLSIFMGCSTAGEIFKNELHDHSICAAIIKLDKTKIQITNGQVSNIEESFILGQKLAEDIPKENLKGIFVLSDGLKIDGSALVEGLKQHLPTKVVLTGGLAGNSQGSNSTMTWTIEKEKPVCGSATLVGFYGDHIEFNASAKGGWNKLGTERAITKAKGKIVFELDHQPALTIYKKYLGKNSITLPTSGLFYPMAIFRNVTDNKPIIRSITAINESDQSIIFAANVPQGWYGQFMQADFNYLIEAAALAGRNATHNKMYPQRGALAIAISGAGRRIILGQRTEEELEAAYEGIGETLPIIGFYAFGEIGAADLHNQTMAITILSEN